MWTVQSKKNNWTFSGVEILCNKLKSLFLKPLYVLMAAFCSPNSFLDFYTLIEFSHVIFQKNLSKSLIIAQMTPLGIFNRDIKGSKLESTGEPIGSTHSSPIRMDVPCGHGRRCTCVHHQIFYFLIRANTVRFGPKQSPNRSDIGQNKCLKKG